MGGKLVTSKTWTRGTKIYFPVYVEGAQSFRWVTSLLRKGMGEISFVEPLLKCLAS